MPCNDVNGGARGNTSGQKGTTERLRDKVGPRVPVSGRSVLCMPISSAVRRHRHGTCRLSCRVECASAQPTAPRWGRLHAGCDTGWSAFQAVNDAMWSTSGCRHSTAVEQLIYGLSFQNQMQSNTSWARLQDQEHSACHVDTSLLPLDDKRSRDGFFSLLLGATAAPPATTTPYCPSPWSASSFLEPPFGVVDLRRPTSSLARSTL